MEMLVSVLNNQRIRLALILSLILHGLVSVALVFGERLFPSRVSHHRTEVELVDPETLQKQIAAMKKQDQAQGQIVDQNDKALNDERDENSKYLSQHNQKVVRETQAALNGKFRNTDGTGARVAPQPQKATDQKATKKLAEKSPVKAAAAEQKQVMTSSDGIETPIDSKAANKQKIAELKKTAVKDLLPNFKPMPPQPEKVDASSDTPADKVAEAAGNGKGPSMSDDHLKDVAKGMQTLLSTREFVYYSYYNRIKDKLRQYWEPKIKEKVTHLLRTGRTIASSTERITRVVIVLDNNGTLMKVQIIGPSGVTDLDDAAAEAFRAAAPFPHPPKGIVEEDGTIKIRWDFILEA
jgi:TonB family protein